MQLVRGAAASALLAKLKPGAMHAGVWGTHPGAADSTSAASATDDLVQAQAWLPCFLETLLLQVRCNPECTSAVARHTKTSQALGALTRFIPTLAL